MRNKMMDKHGMVQSGVTPPEDDSKKASDQEANSVEELKDLAGSPVTRVSEQVSSCKGCGCGKNRK
jgi:hypothetical protein